MTEQTNLVPKRRFKEFSNTLAWEQHKLGEITSFITKGTTPTDKSWIGPVNYIKTESIDSLSGNITIKANTSLEEHEGYLKRSQLKEKDILFSIVGTLGRVGIVESKDLPANTNQQIAIIRLKDSNTNFILNALKTNHIQSFIKSDSTIGAQPSLSLWQINDLQISIPIHKEQKQIGTFFKQLDILITLHQRKLEKTKALKSAYLSEMFPAEGERVPKRRFAGFTQDWEQRKVGEIADIVRGASPRPIHDPKWFDDESDIGWLRIADVTEQSGRIHYLEQRISKAGQEKTRVLTEPHLLLSIAATVGKPVVNYVKTGVHDGFLIFQNPKFDREFMFQWLEMFRPKWQKYGQPGSQVNLNSDLVKNQDVTLPSEKEQKKIGDFFAQLDHRITLHQRKLEKLQNLKKAYLNEMFV